jgi:hypothetical protein
MRSDAMMSKKTGTAVILSLAIGAASFPGAASGQLPSASTAALATANNYTALARGFTAIALNPAGLAMPGNPGFSLSFPTFPVEARAGLNALTISEVNEFEGIALPDATREAWLTSVTAEEGLTARAGIAITEFALSVGPIGFQVSTVAQANATMAPDAFELAMYGNAGRTGTTRDMTLEGTGVNGWAAPTAALAFGFPLPDVQGGTFAAGATLKYTLGHVVVTGGDDGTSVIRTNPIMLDLSLPSIAPDSFTVNNGSGVGLDLGVAWEDSIWAFTASIQNVFHTFQWNLDAYAYRPGELIVDGTSVSDDFDAVPATTAPGALQNSVLAQSFDPVLILGAAYRVSEKLAVTGDLRKDTGDALVHGAGSHIGMGVEFRGLSFMPLRGGFSRVSGGAIHLAAGLGLELGPVHFSGAYLTEKNSAGEFRAASFALSFSHN